MFIKPKRVVGKVFIHCSASDIEAHDNVETISKWHKQRGFAEIGYHYYINKQGLVLNGRNIEKIPAAQVGHNKDSIAICLGGLNHFSQEQFFSLKKLCAEIRQALPKVTFHGHCEVSSKSCPNFNYKKVLGSLFFD